MCIAGVILIIVALVILAPLIIALFMMLGEWVSDAWHGDLVDEFYGLAVFVATGLLIFGIILIYNSQQETEQTTIQQIQETNNGNCNNN